MKTKDMAKLPLQRSSVFLITLLCWLLCAVPAAFGEKVFIDSESQFAFARQLMDKGDYSRAISEFDRFIYFFPKDMRVSMARQLMGLCYMETEKYTEARNIFAATYRADPDSPTAKKALFLAGESYYKEGIYDKAADYFQEVLERYPPPFLRNEALYRLGWTRMQENRWREASKDFKQVETVSPLYKSARELSVKSLKGEQLPYKDPTIAGVMAGVLPGLGHVYVSRYKDAVVAFLLNGLFIWATVEAFHQDHNVLGGILAFFEVGWYSGNIYSAINVTHKWNRKVRDDFRKGLLDQISMQVLMSEKRPAGVALSFHF